MHGSETLAAAAAVGSKDSALQASSTTLATYSAMAGHNQGLHMISDVLCLQCRTNDGAATAVQT
jgi:hypothetical protein